MKLRTGTAAAALLGVVLVVGGESAYSSSAIGSRAVAQPATADVPATAAPGTERAAAAHAPLDDAARDRESTSDGPSPAGSDSVPDIPAEELTGVVQQYCQVCHNDQLETGNLSLEGFDVASPTERWETAEKMIVKLRAGMMPPPEMPRPEGDTLLALVETLEDRVDEVAAANPDPGARTFQRLNRAEYESTIRDLLGLEIDAGDYLPLDTKSDNFDNIADVQLLSPTVMDAYMTAAAEVARLAVGNPDATSREVTYKKSGYHSQWERAEGAPYGTRGGISVVHNFPADGEYSFEMAFDNTTTGGFYGNTIRGEQIEISIDGERRLLLDVDQFMHTSEPNMVTMETEPITVPAGPHRVSAVFLKQAEGPVPDLLSPHDWSLADRRIGAGGYGITALPHMKDLVVSGPHTVTGVSETAVRERIFTCRPASPDEERPCAEEILTRLALEAYRRPLTDRDVADVMSFYEEGAADGGFEVGVRTGLQAILASPDFVFRFEPPADRALAERGETYRITDPALASRLSYFLWDGPPDAELRRIATEGRLSDPEVLEAQTRRMLEDPRAEALGARFAAQWLRLQDLDKVHPDRLKYPDYHQQLADAMRRETEMFFNHLVQEDRSLLELLTADYTFVNERLARHYEIPDVAGEHFRRVELTDERRRGLLGHGSVLVLTSHANRTSPVNRGLWVMEVLLGIEPPPPPPNVPDLEETEAVQDGRRLTTRERMEMHRDNPTCNACHQYIDPLGLSLDNFDVTGKWRIRENQMPLDTRGELWDGTPIESPGDLREALLDLHVPVVRTFTKNLLTYALGRRVEHHDMPAVRAITERAEAEDYRLSEFILGVVETEAFQMQRPEAHAAEDEQQQRR